MNTKRIPILAGLIAISIILSAAHQPLVAAPTAGEVKTVASQIGHFEDQIETFPLSLHGFTFGKLCGQGGQGISNSTA
jgi:hypothetical protein